MAKMKNNAYWSKRLANAAWSTYNDTNKFHKELIQIYKKASEDLMLELFKMEAKFAKDGVIDRTAFYQANHLKEMQKGFNSILKELGETVETTGGETILKTGEKLIGTTAEVLNKTGIQLKYNKELAKRLYQEPWKGATFSKRVWKNQNKLFNELNSTVKKGILTGKSVAQMAMDLNRTMDSKLYEASRLVRTETMHHLNAVGMASYKDAGIKKVQEVVTLDERTSSQCAPHDSLIWDIDKAPILPRHPNCRCVLVPYIDIAQLNTSISSGYNDKIYPIDLENINNIKFPQINSLSDRENDKFSESHKELLLFAKQENESKEVAFKMNSLFEEPIKILGGTTEIDLGLGETIFVFHNHPNNESFSDLDIAYFLDNERVKYLSIIKHNGELSVLEKTDEFDLRKAVIEFRRSEKKNQNKFADDVQKRYNLIVEDFLKKEKKTGIRFIGR